MRQPPRLAVRAVIVSALLLSATAARADLSAPTAALSALAELADPPASATDAAHVAGGDCVGLVEITLPSRRGGCTHGPDPAPPGVDPSVPWMPGARSSEPQRAVAAATTGNVPCYGDGESGDRVQAIYSYPADRPDRYATVAPSIVRWAAEMDGVFNTSARQTGGERHVRFVTDSNCNLVVLKVRLSSLGDDSIENTISELAAQGYSRSDRKYLVWNDSNVLCGIAGYYIDDRDSAANANNGGAPGQVGRIDSGCWGLASQGQSIEAHELMHTLGAVQPSAPNATSLGHCTDEADRMCYADGSPGVTLRNVCPLANEPFFDCGKDDYFSTAPARGGYLDTHWNTADSAFLAVTPPETITTAPTASPSPTASRPSPSPTSGPLLPLPLPVIPTDNIDLLDQADGRHELLSPARLLDTRDGTGGRRGALAAGDTHAFPVTGRGGVPDSGVGGVVLNLTVAGSTATSALTVYPAGDDRPVQPNLRFGPRTVRAVAVTVPIGADGMVEVHNATGSAHAVVDVVGWYDDGSGVAASKFSPLPPVRVMDTRDGNGGKLGPLAGGQTHALQLTGRGGVPSTGVAGVVLNMTVTGPTASGFLTAYPTAAKRPLASSLNFVPRQTVPNLVVLGVGTGGRVSIYNSSGFAHVVVDVVGWFDNGSEAALSEYAPVTPSTLLDTRDGTGGRTGPLRTAETYAVQVTGEGGVPGSGVGGVVLSVTVTGPTASSYLTVFPSGQRRPTASNLNYIKGETAANLVVVPVGTGGRVDIYQHSGAAHVVAVVVGYFDDSS